MTVPSYSLLCYAFWFSIWIPVDWIVPIYHAWVFFLLALYQRIYLLAGGAIPDQPDFWFWQFVIVLIGVLVGVLVQWVTMPPPLLTVRHGWESVVLIKFPLLSVAYIASQIIYWRLPAPDNPWGIILSILVTSVIIGITWAWSYDHPWRAGDPVNVPVFWLWVLAVNFLLQIIHYILYTGLMARYVSMIAGGGVFLIILLSQLLIVHWWDRKEGLRTPRWRFFSGQDDSDYHAVVTEM